MSDLPQVKKCQHRRVGMRRMPSEGWYAVCKNCGLMGATAHSEPSAAYLQRREDFREAEILRARPTALSDDEALERAQKAEARA